ncbi:permease [Paenibacillus gorillae]|uniref:permease n=1 Tax=Paenibacillus gorillae TaxID=1243662 RepID=UPI0004B4F427|nr:permease [Paenibacillus gorillae]
MRALFYRYGIHAVFIAIIGLFLVLSFDPGLFARLSLPDWPSMQSFSTFKTILLGILLETLPFLLLGVFVSSFMQLFISETLIRKMIPRHPLLGILVACLLGFLFPVCECGLIPIVRRLIAKGMPLYIGVVFILAGPIVNPVVIAATYTAFRTRPELVYSRLGLALLVGITIGMIIYKFVRYNPLKNDNVTTIDRSGHSSHDHQHNHHHGHQHQHRSGKFLAMMEHAGSEFFDMGKYVMVGSILTAAIQTFLPRASLASIGQGELSSHLFMMGFAYILSLCSTSDAFVASSFVTTFSSASLLTFLVFGPMLDFKSTLMLLSVFKRRFVLLLIILIALSVLAGSIIIGHFYLSPL